MQNLWQDIFSKIVMATLTRRNKCSSETCSSTPPKRLLLLWDRHSWKQASQRDLHPRKFDVNEHNLPAGRLHKKTRLWRRYQPKSARVSSSLGFCHQKGGVCLLRQRQDFSTNQTTATWNWEQTFEHKECPQCGSIALLGKKQPCIVIVSCSRRSLFMCKRYSR